MVKLNEQELLRRKYLEMYEDYYEELEDVYYNGNCEKCIYYIECDCHLQCIKEN